MNQKVFQLTAEQLQAIDHFKSGDNLKIEAFAGTGKTSTLVELAKSAQGKSGHYFAFNRAIADDAKGRFPTWVSTSTVHSVAYQYVRRAYSYSDQRLKLNPTINQVASILQTQPKGYYRFFDRLDLSGREYSGVIHQACKNFLASADAEPNVSHFRRTGKLQAVSDVEFKEFANHYLPNVSAIWHEMQNESGAFPLGHDGYLKLWALSEPRLAKDFILLDEAQDTSDVILNVLAKQRSQLVYVGDEHQQIYEWRGAVNAMQKTESGRSTPLTQSFRFGQTIANAANAVLAKLGAKSLVQGNPEVLSRIGPHEPQTILCRSNVQVIETVVEQMDQSKQCHVVGGIKDLVALLKEVSNLKQGIPSRHPELFGFEDWHDVMEFCEESQGNPLAVLVKLVARFEEQRLIEILKRTAANETHAQVLVSTAHKSKGREWNRVKLHAGFDAPYLHEDEETIDPAEVRLFYVALTRARTHLELPQDAMRHYQINNT